MNNLPLDQLLFEIEDVLRAMPPSQSLGNDDSDVLAWLGRASAAVHAWNPAKATMFFDGYVGRLSSSMARDYTPAMRGVLVMLHQARHDLRMKTTGPLSVVVAKGGVFEYFDELRRVVELARTDVLFVDPYLDAEFVPRYLPFVAKGAAVRLLGREKIPALVAAVGLFAAQHGLSAAVRSSGGLHDRYVLIDGSECYQSGASFKDGAKKAGTTLTQITDAFAGVRDTYEALWTSGTVHL